MNKDVKSPLLDRCEAAEGKHAASESLPTRQAFEALIEPLSLQAPLDDLGSVQPPSASETRKSPSFVAGVSEKLAALAKLLRKSPGNTEGGAERRTIQAEPEPRQEQGHPLKYLTLAAGVLTGIWGWRAARSMERVVSRRYSDIAYQIRRPDSISARISAFKFLVLGGLVLPGSGVAFVSWQSRLQLSRSAGAPHEPPDTDKPPLQSTDISNSRRPLISEVLPLGVQIELRRMAVSFRGGLEAFVEAVAPSREKWAEWAAGARVSHISGFQRPSAVGSRLPTWVSEDSKSAD
ncbi:hypothetical protein cyc_03090 [Cyclospora cayetanensis]|nr:hypothetical protein cyc_03090 [Cyclospora cayetanensis]